MWIFLIRTYTSLVGWRTMWLPRQRESCLLPFFTNGSLTFITGAHHEGEREDTEKKERREREKRNGRNETGECNEDNSMFAAPLTRRGLHTSLSFIVTISVWTLDKCNQTLHTKENNGNVPSAFFVLNGIHTVVNMTCHAVFNNTCLALAVFNGVNHSTCLDHNSPSFVSPEKDTHEDTSTQTHAFSSLGVGPGPTKFHRGGRSDPTFAVPSAPLRDQASQPRPFPSRSKTCLVAPRHRLSVSRSFSSSSCPCSLFYHLSRHGSGSAKNIFCNCVGNTLS